MKILFCVLAYLVGSIPTGYLFFRISEKKDIRQFGSHATGATNVLRLKGWKYAVPVLVLDVLKGALPALLAVRIFQDRTVAVAASVAVVVGHCYPLFIRFRGGKGVAASMGAYLVLGFYPFLISLLVFVTVIAVTRYVSLGALLATGIYPLSAWLTGNRSNSFVIWSLGIFCVIFIRHWGNIQRLLKGEERKLGQKEKVE